VAGGYAGHRDARLKGVYATPCCARWRQQLMQFPGLPLPIKTWPSALSFSILCIPSLPMSASELRNRFPLYSKSDQSSDVPSFSKHNIRHPYKPKFTATSSVSRLIYVLTTLLSISGLVFYNSRQTELPSSYALCSRDDYSIYTVDSLKPLVQCIVVQGSRITDYGSIG